MKLADQHFACLLLLLTPTCHWTTSPSVPQHCQPSVLLRTRQFLHADSDADDDVPQPSFHTDAAATAASDPRSPKCPTTSSSAEVSHCCEECLVVSQSPLCLVNSRVSVRRVLIHRVTAIDNDCLLCRSRLYNRL